MSDLRSLEIFYWAAQLKSFSRTAERLNTTQPAVSQRISALEAEFGTRLFDRGAKAISLTPKGQVLVDFAERFLRLRGEMVEAMATPSAIRGTLRLGVSESIARLWLNQFLQQAHQIYPNVVIDLTIDITPIMRDQLRRGELDLAFFLGPVTEPQFCNVPLCTLPLVFAAAPDLVLEHEEPLSIEAVRKFPIITYPKTTSPYPLLRELLSSPNEPAPRIFGNSSLTTIIRMTRDRIGLSVIPRAVIEKEIAEGLIRTVLTAFDIPPHVFTATYPMAMSGGLAGPLADLAQKISHEALPDNIPATDI
ncbi:MAG: LysR family transcriptional regulator [Rhizobiales bacterium PAR1]|nr:MAG: LysR family transcriptional regulator [Rhizobiales bacterium PAR1]